MEEPKMHECKCPACGAIKEVEDPKECASTRCDTCGIVMEHSCCSDY